MFTHVRYLVYIILTSQICHHIFGLLAGIEHCLSDMHTSSSFLIQIAELLNEFLL